MDPLTTLAIQLRSRVVSLLGLFALSEAMFDSVDEHTIVDLAIGAVPSLGPVRAVLGLLTVDGQTEYSALTPHAGNQRLIAQVRALRGEDGPVTVEGCAWAHAYGLRSLGTVYGWVVTGAPAEPPPDTTMLMALLGRQAGAALAGTAMRRHAGVQTKEVNLLNEQLTAAILDLAHRTHVHEELIRVFASGEGDEGIARAIHSLTGLPVLVEDRFGNAIAWAGPVPPDLLAGHPDARRHRELVGRARLSGRPVRDGQRLVAVAQSRGDVLGAVSLIDPGGTARPEQIVPLELGAVVLAVSLTQGRSLADLQVRLRRELVDDLLGGTDDASAIARAEAQGHDLRRPHTVVAVQWSEVAADPLCHAVERAAAQLEMGGLVARTNGAVLLVAQHPDWWHHSAHWDDLHRSLQGELGPGPGSIGVGSATTPAGLRRSQEQALHALSIRAGSTSPHGVTTYEDLGIYRILGSAENRSETDAFVREWLGALIDYDNAHRAKLVRTLAEYCESGGNYDVTAAGLRIHRSTLRYRLQRIRDVGGRDINDVDSRFNLHVATKAWRMLGG
ncbi:MAG TPA: helix-turn-helix domain-containing protein [Candidatus Dormibacteraeota bacterium]|jgi:hypothetical protein|nr:helix-turn-helix domain-containing protein [Candidatus Dormibacteraeota bacterium]